MGSQGHRNRRSLRPQNASPGWPTWETRYTQNSILKKRKKWSHQRREWLSKWQVMMSTLWKMHQVMRNPWPWLSVNSRRCSSHRDSTPKNSIRDQIRMKDHWKVKNFSNNNESNIGPCFGCGFVRHVVKDHLIFKKNAKG